MTAVRPSVRLLGEPAVLTESGRVAFRTAKVPALLAYLVARGRPVPRIEIAEALWPGREPALAAHSLRQTLVYLRDILGDEAVLANRRDVRLAQDGVEVDVEGFRAALAAAPPALHRVVELYRGPFMAGYEGDWLLPVRAELSQSFVRALLDLSDEERVRNPARALALAERAVAEEPFHDGARARKISALRSMGEETRALREFEAYEALLDEELGLCPAPIVEAALADRVALKSPPQRSEPPSKPDLGDALRVLAFGERPEEALRLAVSLAPYWIELGTPGEGLRRLDEARGSVNAPDRRLRATSCLAAGELAVRTSDFERALREGREALEGSDETETTVQTLLLLARVHSFLRNPDTARGFAVRALRILRTEGLPTGPAWACLTSVHGQGENPARVVATGRRAQANAGSSKRSFARAGITMSYALNDLGRAVEGRTALAVALEAIAHDRSPETTGMRLSAARHYETFGDLDRAERGYAEGIEESRRQGNRYSLGIGLTYLGDLKTSQGDPAAAIPLHEEALQERIESGNVLGAATSLRGLGAACLALGDAAKARAFFREAVLRYSEVGWNPGVASCLVPLARAEAVVGSRAVAGRLAARSVRLLRETPPVVRAGLGPRGAELLPEAEALLVELTTE